MSFVAHSASTLDRETPQASKSWLTANLGPSIMGKKSNVSSGSQLSSYVLHHQLMPLFPVSLATGCYLRLTATGLKGGGSVGTIRGPVEGHDVRVEGLAGTYVSSP